MKVEITQAGVRMAGAELEKGTVIEVKGDKMPASLVNKAVVVKGGKTAITNPAKDPVQQSVGYAVVEKSPGWFVVTHDGKEATKAMRKADLEGFDAMSDEDKGAFVDLQKAEA